MTDYRVYILNDKGHIQSDTAIVSADDAQAIEAAKKIVGARNVELWDGELDSSIIIGVSTIG